MTRERYHRAFVLFLVIAVLTLFVFMIRGIIVPLLLAGIFSALIYPLYRRALDVPGLRGRPALASALLVVLALIAIVIPFAGLLGLVMKEAVHISENIIPWVRETLSQFRLAEKLPDWVPFHDTLDPYKDAIMEKLGQETGAIASFLVSSGSALTQGTFSFFLGLFVMLYAMFFFLLYGKDWLIGLARYLPLTNADRAQVLDRGMSVTRATFKSIIVIGVLQGAMIAGAFAVLGIDGALFWGTIVAVLSAIPALGPPVVWVPAALYLLLTDRTAAAIGLILWGTLVVGTVDNILRPRIVGGEARMPDLLIFVSILGGITMFGALGIILGPVVAAVMVTVLDIYHHVFVKDLAKTHEP